MRTYWPKILMLEFKSVYSYVGNKRGVEISGDTGNFSKINKRGGYNKSVGTDNNSNINNWEGV